MRYVTVRLMICEPEQTSQERIEWDWRRTGTATHNQGALSGTVTLLEQHSVSVRQLTDQEGFVKHSAPKKSCHHIPIYLCTIRVLTVLLRVNSANSYMLTMLSVVLLSRLITEPQKPSSPGLEPRTHFRDCFICSCNLPAETTLVLVPFLYRAWFPS
jgi:hypothetical protein